jgi:phosphatidate cytidylyltransferase
VNDTAPAPGVASAPDARNLLLRVVSSAALAPVAVATAYFGGWVFIAFWTIAALAIWWEWVHLVYPSDHRGPFITGACALALAAALAGADHSQIALFITALGAIAVTVLSSRDPAWIAGGVVYAGALLLASVYLREETPAGFVAIVFLFAVVWSADVAGYFAGRAFGGPKLAPSISPKKTWSGAIGGLFASIAAALAMAQVIGSNEFLRAALLGGMLSVAAQAGDLFESRIKRRFDVKDSGGLIPGHGGVMDRLDGYLAAAVVFAMIDVTRDMAGVGAARFIVW